MQNFAFEDGAYSAVRENLLRQGRINFSRQYIGHGYKELRIPPSSSSSSPTLKRVEGLHIWPRGEVMLIALPNPDKSFTATLFAPYAGASECGVAISTEMLLVDFILFRIDCLFSRMHPLVFYKTT